MEKIRVLYLAASPAGGPPEQEIDVDGDYDAIHEAIDAAGGTDHFEFRRVWGVRPKDLVDQLRNWRPHIVHFSGHGLRGKGLVFTDDLGAAVLAAPAGLTGIFKVARKDDVRLVVLMTCYGLPLARALAPHVQVAIGIEDRLADDAATDFNRAFYAGLAGGRSLQEAYDQGYAMVRLRNDTHARNRPELAPGPRADLSLAVVGERTRAKPLRSAPIDSPESHLEQGLRLLDLRLYQDAAMQFRHALRVHNSAQAHYYLAFALLRGRRPAQLASLDEVRAIESHLAASVQLGQDCNAHPLFLWAWVKLDYYRRHRLTSDGPPDVSTLLAQATRVRHDPGEIDRILLLVPPGTPDDAVIAVLRSRQAA